MPSPKSSPAPGPGRRTVSSWLRAAGISDDDKDYYYFLGSLGRKVKSLATLLAVQIAGAIPLGDRVLLALDHTPTKRHGPEVEGASIHHNPTPGRRARLRPGGRYHPGRCRQTGGM